MIKKLLLLACLTLFFSCSSTEPVKPVRALLLTGGCCHDYILQEKLLTEGTKARMNIEWDVLNEGGKGFSHRYSIFTVLCQQFQTLGHGAGTHR